SVLLGLRLFNPLRADQFSRLYGEWQRRLGELDHLLAEEFHRPPVEPLEHVLLARRQVVAGEVAALAAAVHAAAVAAVEAVAVVRLCGGQEPFGAQFAGHLTLLPGSLHLDPARPVAAGAEDAVPDLAAEHASHGPPPSELPTSPTSGRCQPNGGFIRLVVARPSLAPLWTKAGTRSPGWTKECFVTDRRPPR